jgi:hypothetical protein
VRKTLAVTGLEGQEGPLVVYSVDDSLVGGKKDVAKQDALIEADDFDLYRRLLSPYLYLHRPHSPKSRRLRAF